MQRLKRLEFIVRHRRYCFPLTPPPSLKVEDLKGLTRFIQTHRGAAIGVTQDKRQSTEYGRRNPAQPDDGHRLFSK